jgi:hypothetical protein
VRPGIELVLNMDGFGSQSLKRTSYRAVMRQFGLPYAGFKLFYHQDTNLFQSKSHTVEVQDAPTV